MTRTAALSLLLSFVLLAEDSPVTVVEQLFDAVAHRDTAKAAALFTPDTMLYSLRADGAAGATPAPQAQHRRRRRNTGAAGATPAPQAQHRRRRRNTGAAGATPAPKWLERMAAGKEQWLEKIREPKQLEQGQIAHVWAAYTFHLGGKLHHCGIDSVSLLRTSAGWKIASISDTRETVGCAE